MGGTCKNDGWVPTRVLAHAARLVRDAEQFADYGIVGERPAVDFTKVLEGARASVKEVREKNRLFARLEAGGVRVFAGIGASLARTSLASRQCRSCS
jgi:pyruvate/2-oxoglutarate dehydrogenase complex dihydrolipoamide dehydrogenase (E3) component